MSTVFFGNLKIFRFFGFSGFEFRGFGFGFRGFGFGFRGSGFGFRGSGFGFRFRGSGLIDFTVKFTLVIHGKACCAICKRLLHGTKLCCMQYGTQMYAVRNMAVCDTEHGCSRYGTWLLAARSMAARGTGHGCSRYGTWLLRCMGRLLRCMGRLPRCMGSGCWRAVWEAAGLTLPHGKSIIGPQGRVCAALNQEAGPSPAPDRGRRWHF